MNMNKRPLPFMLAGFVLGEVWIWQFQRAAALAALVLAVIILMGYSGRNQSSLFFLKSMIPMLALGMLAGGISSYKWFGQQKQFERLKDGNSYIIEGQIEEKKEGENTTSLVLKSLFLVGKYENQENGAEVAQQSKKQLKGRILLYAPKELSYGIGYRVVFRGIVESVPLPGNPGEFNAQRYQESKGVFGCCFEPEILEQRYGSFLVGEGLRQFRDKMSVVYTESMNENQSGPALAMVLGDKSNLETEQKQLYQLGGISHVLAVSGLHMTLIGAGFYKILRKIGFAYGISAVSSFPCILAYAIMTGSSSSCLRASLMLVFYLIGEWVGLSYDLISSLCLAGILLLLEMPGRLFDSSFLLSFGAMGGIGFFYPVVKDCFGDGKRRDSKTRGSKTNQQEGLLGKIRQKIVTGMVGSLCITVFTLPLMLYFFYGFSPAGIFLNLIVIPVMSLLVPLLVFGGFLSLFQLTNPVGACCLFVGGEIIDFYEFLCQIAEKIPGGYLTLGYRGVLFGISYYLILFLGVYFCSRVHKKAKNVAVMMVTVGFLITVTFITGRRDTFLTVLDVGQGDGILFHSREEVCMIDGGSTSKKQLGSYVLEPALSYYGISYVDNWFVSHGDEDHLSGIRELLEEGYPIGRLILPVMSEKTEQIEKLEYLAKKNKTEVIFMDCFDELQLKEGRFVCLHPAQNTMGEDSNENSLVLILSLPYQNIFLTGDVENAGEEELNRVLLDSGSGRSWHEKNYKNWGTDKQGIKEQILKVSHHGSSNGTGEEFLSIIKPDTALISCGKNNRYGHPGSDTLERLNQINAKIYRTDRQGAIEIRCKKQTEYVTFK